MLGNPRTHTTVSELLDNIVLPNPATPVPFERFAALKDSSDMLERAAFWCFYAAWQADSNGRGPADIPIEARHDGHTLHAISKDIAIRDCLLVRANYVYALEEAYKHPHRSSMSITLFVGAVCFLLGVLTGLAALGYFNG